MNIKKKLISMVMAVLTAIILIAAGFGRQDVKAASGNVSISVSSANVIAGNNFEVYVTVNVPTGISVAQMNFNYDSNLLTSNDGNYAGVIDLTYMDTNNGPPKYTWTLSFKAKTTGTCNFSVSNINCMDMETVTFVPTANTASVKIWAPGSDDASLSSLNVSGYSLSPAFSSGTTDYTCYVGNEVTAVNVSAVATQGGRTEMGGNPGSLSVGNNYVTITSYAPNGATRKYTINIVRSEPPTEPETTTPEETTATPDEVEIKIGDKNYVVSSEFNSENLPSGFDIDIVNFKGKDVLGAVNDDFTLLYLVDESKKGAFYIYNKDKISFFKYTAVVIKDKKYVFMDENESDIKMDGCTKGTQTINDNICDVWISDTNKEFVYFYAMNEAKEIKWYCYDTVEGTVQRVNVISASGNSQGEASEKDLQVLSDEIKKLKEEKNTLMRAKESRNIIIIACGIIVIILSGVLVALAARKKDKRDEDVEDTDLEDAEADSIIAESEMAATTEAASEAETEAEPESEAEPAPEAGPEAEAESEAETEPEAETETEAESEAETEPEAEAETEAETETEPETDAESEPENDSYKYETVTPEEVNAFAKEAEDYNEDAHSADEIQDINPEIITLDDEQADIENANADSALTSTDTTEDASDDVETINASDIKDEDFLI